MRVHYQMEENPWTWVPGKSVSFFHFGLPMPPNLPWEIVRLPPDVEDADWLTFRVGNELARVYLEHGVISDIECSVSLLLEGDELLGRTIEDFNRRLPVTTTLKETYLDGTEVWPCDALGLTAWVKNGRVESATVAGVFLSMLIG